MKDIDTVSYVDGFDLLARSLSYGNVTVPKLNPSAIGFRWELDSAAQLTRNGIEIERFTKILLSPGSKKVSTDIDFILKNGTYVQAKASKSTIGGVTGTAPLGSEKQIRNWVEKAKLDGATEIIYVVPRGTHITPGKRAIFKKLNVRVVSDYLLK